MSFILTLVASHKVTFSSLLTVVPWIPSALSETFLICSSDHVFMKLRHPSSASLGPAGDSQPQLGL